MNKNEIAKIVSERTKLKKTDCINCHAVSFCVGEFRFRSVYRDTCNLTIVFKDFTLSLQGNYRH